MQDIARLFDHEIPAGIFSVRFLNLHSVTTDVRVMICFAAGAMHNPHIRLCIEVPGFQRDDRRLYWTLSPCKKIGQSAICGAFGGCILSAQARRCGTWCKIG